MGCGPEQSKERIGNLRISSCEFYFFLPFSFPALVSTYADDDLSICRVNGTFNREYDLSASRAVGFDERIDTVQGYYTSFDRTRAANIIP